MQSLLKYLEYYVRSLGHSSKFHRILFGAVELCDEKLKYGSHFSLEIKLDDLIDRIRKVSYPQKVEQVVIEVTGIFKDFS